MVGPLETKEAAMGGILVLAMASFDSREAVTPGILLRIHGDLTLRGALTLRTPVYNHGYTKLHVTITLKTLVQIQDHPMLGPLLLRGPDVGTLVLQRRLGRRDR